MGRFLSDPEVNVEFEKVDRKKSRPVSEKDALIFSPNIQT